jgi:alkanesulfonate monooxygenase SsuD/methylene tetrahydromethanopterin reductase-like flavin-dependent oxidoreductase (luciferase family)
MERVALCFVGGVSPTDVVEYAQLAEELGYESLWIADGYNGDQFCMLTACALATKKILLGTSITNIFVRSAPTIAMSAACVDYYANGRFILGLGSSHKVQVEGDHGLPFSKPIPRLLDFMEIIRTLIRDGEVSYQGEVINIKRFWMWFEWIKRDIPIYFSAVFPKMLGIAGEVSDGVILPYASIDQSKIAAEHVATGARRAGRDPKDVDMGSIVHCALSTNKEEAIERMKAGFAHSLEKPRYRRVWSEMGFPEEVEAAHQAWKAGDTRRAIGIIPSALVEKFNMVGTPEECQEKLQEFRHAGITLPFIVPREEGNLDKARTIEVIHACAPK